MRLVSDNDDTTAGDEAARYLDIAQAEGFFVAAKFETVDAGGQAESLWILNEPYSGFLLTVASSGELVADATLHYNLHTDDAGMSRTPFPEHRDPGSHTIYVRETCIDALRAKCQRLRSTNALVREWKVSPAMSFITPGEWQSIAMSERDEARKTLSTLNHARAAGLPDGVRAQFGLTVPGEQQAT